MNISDLLALLHEEFALDVPMAQQAALDAAAQPGEAAALLEPVVGYIERSVQASALVSLDGWGNFLSQVSQFTQLQMMSPDHASLQWLAGWTTPALAYLESPAQAATAQAIIAYLKACPQATDDAALSVLHAQLLVPPALTSEEAAAAQAVVEDATLEDVSLQTDDVDGGLLSAMLQDAPEQLERLMGYLDELVAGKADSARMIEAQRIAHTFKGSGNIIGLPGIGRIAHRLEDVMEWTIEQVQAGEGSNSAALQDMRHSVGILQHMVAHLQGEEAPPGGAQECLQRLIDWVNWIRQGVAAAQSPEPLAAQGAMNVVAFRADITPANSINAGQNEPQSADVQMLRVGVDRLSRVLRRATQSIVASQRVGQLVRTANDRLSAIEVSHAELARRLRELEQTVDKQVVQLRGQKESGESFDPLEMDRYDALYTLSRFVTEAVQDELELAREARNQVALAQQLIRDEDQIQREQHRDLLGARLVPVKSILPRLKRNVAQTAASTGKQAQLVVEGDNTTLDADVLTRLTEPLLHLLRNAVDHGLESTEERHMLGKNEVGTITLSFRRVGQDVELICADDGKGLDLPTIYDKAVEYGLIEQGTELSEDEMRRLILRPGFSTKGEVTEVSGRGVGMDVVNDRVSGLKGRLDIESQPYAGSRFIVRVPVSSGAVQALIVQSAQEEVALPSDQVVQALAADEVEIIPGASPVLRHLGQEYPVYPLGVWLGFEDTHTTASLAGKPAVLCRGATQTVAVIVDAVVDARELILQDVGRLARRIAGVVGGALRNDGRPMFLLDVAALERASQTTRRAGSSLALRRRMAVQRTRVLVVDDALSVRRSMEQLLEDAGYDVVTAADGFLALEVVRSRAPAIVLTDLEMPNLNGLELTKRLRELPQFMGTPIVMITSRASDKHREMAEEAGVDLYLTKPYTDATLIEHVKRLTSQDASALLV
ncbi:response regulator [Variovorax sp. PCZ-1]|uniref:hybrid sensor histidine kinase/response regulator n=1 Tax=Variovorax sp. PCZ-1 TaxID=2835533 RepID=UPI001BD03A86|nr:response regulator [Variovorax sp. PCZ-1]MBS7808665.1 response regulator [Variovorax sp. PCZ-1]